MRKVCVYTSTRAEYGILRRLIFKIRDSRSLKLNLLVSGTHLEEDQGMTIREILNDGISPHQCISIELMDDSPNGICRSMGVALTRYGSYLSKSKPDLLLLLGDRFETFCCAVAGQVCGIPIAHLHGGETTQGAVDEAFRHSITKMAQLHFPSCDIYRQRIIQMGELPENVYNVGSLGAENIRYMNFLDRHKIEESIGFLLDSPFFLITYHPVTLESGTASHQVRELLRALDHFSEFKCIFTQANADAEGKNVNQILHEYCKHHPNRCYISPSLGNLRYLSAMKLCDAVIGNSSSGMLEAPLLRVPTINIGDRQKGRLRTESIIDCRPEKKSIIKAIHKIYNSAFRERMNDKEIPFEAIGTAENIINVIEKANLSKILKKQFFDIQLPV